VISIERVTNGYIVRIEEGETDETLVCQREYDSMNMALLAVFKQLCEQWQDVSEPQIKLDIGG